VKHSGKSRSQYLIAEIKAVRGKSSEAAMSRHATAENLTQKEFQKKN
jgi:hypothetical protein